MNKAIYAAIILSTATVVANPYYPETRTQPAGHPSMQSDTHSTPSRNPAGYNGFQKNNQMQAKPAANGNGTVVDIVASEPSISTLASAIQAADLEAVLGRPGPYTLLAPSNEAFKKLSPETLANLLKPENKEKLKAILKNHVIPGKILAADVKSETLYSLDGKPIEIKVNGKDVRINGAKLIKTDIQGSNGVIHIIDTVLVPKN